MDIIKILERIKKRNEDNAVKTRTFTEDYSKISSEDIVTTTVNFINGNSIRSHRNYNEYVSTRGQSHPIIFFGDEIITEINSISDDDFIRDDETDRL